MKKSSAFLILIFLIFFLFIFENLRSLFHEVEQNELESIKEMLKTKAQYYILESNSNINDIKKNGYFKKIRFVIKDEREGIAKDEKGNLFFHFVLRSRENSFIRFDKKLDFAVFKTVKSIMSIISALTLLLGLLVVLTGIYLIVVFRKKKIVGRDNSVPLLQGYLSQLENARSELGVEIEKQKIDVIRTDEINKSIINNIGAAIIYVDNSGTVDIFNSHAEIMFNKKYVNAKNVKLTSVLSGYEKIAAFVENCKKKSDYIEVEDAGKVFFVELNSIRSGGKVIIIRDISDRKRKDSVRNQKRNFEQLGEMALFLTHEIRNSLGVIYGYTKTLKEEKEKTKKINNEVEFLKGMMESFLRFSKPLKIRSSEDVGLELMLKKIADDYQLKISIESPGESIFRTDPDLLYSVFTNLLKNSKESGADKICVNIDLRRKGTLNIILSDNGRGLREELKDKIWLPFYTSKEKGTGMGLPLVKKIINTLEGEISVLDTKKTGAKFSISFFDN